MKKVRGKEALGHLSGVSPLNFDEDVRAGMNLPKRVVVNDLTLREGRQLEGVVLTVDECVRIARQLEELGVPMIQIANFSAYDYDIMKALGKLNLKMKTECMTSQGWFSLFEHMPSTNRTHIDGAHFRLAVQNLHYVLAFDASKAYACRAAYDDIGT